MFKPWILVLTLMCCGALEASEPLYYPSSRSEHDARQEFPVTLLKHAIERLPKADQYRLQAVHMVATQERDLRMILSGDLDIFWTATTIEREQLLEPVRVPIFGGLLGWRVSFVHASKPDLLAEVRTVKQLKRYVLGAGNGWPETPIFRHLTLRVTTSPSYEGLFNMLSLQRFDVFPRGVMEIQNEFDAFNSKDIATDRHLLIRYPYALYYFVHPDNKPLARALEAALVSMFEEGSYQTLFDHYINPRLAALELDKRTTLDMPNPLFPTIAEPRKKFFFKPVGTREF